LSAGKALEDRCKDGTAEERDPEAHLGSLADELGKLIDL
jgi:hypothetical protein